MMLSSLERMQPGDMPQFDPAMKLAAVTFANLNDAAIKHMVIISDGDPSPPSPQTVKLLVDGKVDRLDDGGRVAWHAGKPSHAGHRGENRRQVLRRKGPPSAAALLSKKKPGVWLSHWSSISSRRSRRER